VDDGKLFSLSSLKMQLGRRCVEQMRSIEVYDSLSDDWTALSWSSWVGPIAKRLDAFFFRYDGVTKMGDLGNVRSLACRLPGHKGKARQLLH